MGSWVLPAIALLLSLLLVPTKALAQAEVKTLTLDDALAIAMEQNRDVQTAMEYQKWVRGKYVEERAAALPQVTISLNGSRNTDESMISLYPAEFREFFPTTTDVANGSVGLSQALYTWGQVGAAIKAAKEGIADAEVLLEKARQDARRDVTASFYDVLLAKEILAISRENLAQKERHLDEAKKKFDLGTATDYDVLAAEVAVQNARPEVIRNDNNVRTAREKLRFLLADPAPSVDVSGSLETEIAPAPSYEDTLATALSHRPDLLDDAHRVAIAQQLVKIANAGDKPRLDLMADWGHRKYWMEGITTQGKLWNVGLYISFPIFDGLRTRGRVMQAISDRTVEEIKSAKARDGVAVEVRVAVDALQEATEIAAALSGTVAQAEKLRLMAEKGFEYGVKTKLEVDEAQLNVMMAKGNLARAKRDYLVSLVNLEWVQGTLDGIGPAPGAREPGSPKVGDATGQRAGQ